MEQTAVRNLPADAIHGFGCLDTYTLTYWLAIQLLFRNSGEWRVTSCEASRCRTITGSKPKALSFRQLPEYSLDSGGFASVWLSAS